MPKKWVEAALDDGRMRRGHVELDDGLQHDVRVDAVVWGE